MEEVQSCPAVPGNITQLLLAWSDGDEEALLTLVPLVYEELRRRAWIRLRRESRGSTLQPTALVHEVYLRLIEQSRVDWRSRAHFFSIAALMMRRIVIDHARRRRYAKRGGDAIKLSLDESTEPSTAPKNGLSNEVDFLILDQALRELAAFDPDLSRLVELRFFGGLTQREIGTVLGLSVPTITRRWRLARAWLYRYLEEGRAGDFESVQSKRRVLS